MACIRLFLLKIKFNNDLKPFLDAFKAAHLFSHFKFHELKPSATDIDFLKAFPFEFTRNY